MSRAMAARVRTPALARALALGAALMLGACATPQRHPPSPLSAPRLPAPASSDGFVARIEADARQSDHEADAAVRAGLALDATRNANDCLGLAPQSAACLYGNALALGLEARVHPTRATGLLKEMLEALNRAEAADPAIDEAGPARVTAQVLVKAPGWPLGPGDPESGLAAARRAVARRSDYPPNQLALAEALEKTGNSSEAQEAYAQARRSALALPESTERDAWVKDADVGLRGR